MATILMEYTGNLRTKSKHLLSGKELMTDAPVDNQGKGETYSPTDLVANALASCILTTIGIAANFHQFNIDGTKARITKIMKSNPRAIAEVKIELTFPFTNYPDKVKRIIMSTIKNCPVALSLHPNVVQHVTTNI